MNLAATAADPDGHVTAVQFYNGNGTKLGEDMTTPYTFAWSGVGSGTYALTAKAIDNDGAVHYDPADVDHRDGRAPPNQPPTVTLTQPANGAKFTAPATVSLAATASDTEAT